MAQFRFKEIRDLQGVLALSPAEVRLRYADRLEELLLELDPERVYPYEFVYFRITGFRPEGDRRETYSGEDVLPDLLLALDMIAETVPRHVDDVEDRVYTLPEVEEICEVSVRTLHRWRRRGLVSSRFVFPDGRKRTGIRERALERFIERNEESVEWSRRFSKLTAEEETEMLERIRHLVGEEGLSLTAAAARVAEQAGRSPETVRLLVKRHGREHPQDPVFGQPSRQMGPEGRRRIYAEHRQGTPVQSLQQRHGRSRSSIYRVINRERAGEALRNKLVYFAEEAFEDSDAGADILGAELRSALDVAVAQAGGTGAPGGPTWVLDDGSPLTRGQEVTLFRAYNYLKYLIAEAQDQIDPKRYIPTRLIRHVESLEERARQIKESLLYAHLPLVTQAARQHAGEALREKELTDAGKECLQEQLESFDFRGRLRFARRVRLELLKRFARMAPEPVPGDWGESTR